MTREEAIERLKQNKAAAEFYAGMVQNTNAIENELKDIEAMNMAIEALSAAEPKTGKWIAKSERYRWMRKCSVCGWMQEIDTPKMQGWIYRYCPNCGARMLGEDGEDK